MAKLRHITIATHDLEGTADFYQKLFDMEIVGRSDNELATGIQMSDGVVNLTLLHFKNPKIVGRPEGLDYVGLHHIGFWVESLDEAEGRLKAHGVPLFVDRPPAERGGGAFFEIKVKDPNGVIVDLNNGGWVGAKP